MVSTSKILSLSLLKLAIVLQLARIVNSSVLTPPTFRYLSLHNNLSEANESVPYQLTVNEGSLDVQVQTSSLITVNLNRPVPEATTVVIKILSKDGLISLDVHSNFTFEPNTFGDRVVIFHSEKTAGHASIVFEIPKQPAGVTIDYSKAFTSVNVFKSSTFNLLILIVGWIYFFAWSASFYFQVVLNYRRKSVVGLNFDFLALNLLGFSCYLIYNSTLLFSQEVRDNYYSKYTYSRIPVEYNDLFFALHAFILTLVTIGQCFKYERGSQTVSIPACLFIAVSIIASFILYAVHLFNALTILTVVLFLSYVKLIITIIKYTPQAYMNYKRKATSGWSIHNILLDFTGGIFSIAQMFLLAYNYDDWNSIFGNFTKFGLGAISMGFDILFVTQHYFLYRESGARLEDSTESIPSPVISQSIRSLNADQPHAQSDQQQVNSEQRKED